MTLAAFLALAGTAHAQGEVSVGGLVEVIAGTSDSDNDNVDGVDGLSRGLFSRINVDYRNTLDNGLEVGAKIQYQLRQRGGTIATASPDELFVSVGGGFGTVSVGAHAPASCALLPRPIAFVPGGTNATWYTLFTGFPLAFNTVFTEANYCSTPESISYATPTISGLKAMVTYSPNTGATQATTLREAVALDLGYEDYVAGAVAFSTAMGGMDLELGASFQTSSEDQGNLKIDSQSVAATIGTGGATFGFAWHDNGADGDTGYTVAAKYALGSITPAVAYSVIEPSEDTSDPDLELSALTVGATFAMGGGLSVFAEYMNLEYKESVEAAGITTSDSTDEDLLMGGIIVSF